MNKYERMKKIIDHPKFSNLTTNSNLMRLVEGDLKDIGDAMVEGEDIFFYGVTPPSRLKFTEPAEYYAIKKPTVNIGGKEPNATQLTKREQFAMASMQGMLVSDRYRSITLEEVSKLAVRSADSLLARLEKDK